MRWKIGLHFYWWRPAKWKKNNSWRVEKDEKNIWRSDCGRGRPSRLVSCDFDKRKPCVWHARDDTVLGLSVGPSIYHYRRNQRLLLLKYWPGHDVCNRTLEINLKRTPVTIEAVQRIMPLSSCFTSTIKDYISHEIIKHHFLSLFLFLFFWILRIYKITGPADLSIYSSRTFEGLTDTCRLLVSPTASHSFWWRSWSQTSAHATSVRSMSMEWLTYWTHLWMWEAN